MPISVDIIIIYVFFMFVYSILRRKANCHQMNFLVNIISQIL